MSDNRSGVSQPQHHDDTPRASDASLTAVCAGANFSIYAVRELIGVGSVASVYRAHDTRLRREVALKMLNTEALAGAAGLARFLHEARMAAAVRHPNVVNIFDVGVHDSTPFIVMELLTGEDLDARLRAARALREPVLIDIALQLVSGLAAVHDTGVVHRDLKPSNVFLSQAADGSTQPKLLDFSISKQTRDNLRLTTNGRRRWAAMPLYTAPEVLLDGDATFHSDQYSLGVLLYECVTGVNPFRADTARESIQLITTGQARRVTDQPIRPSRRLAAVIEKAMHVYPDQRFANLHELGQALASVSQQRVRWPWAPSAEPIVARAPLPAAGTKGWQAPLDPAQSSGGKLGWFIGAAVIGCSIGAPIWAWWASHRQASHEQRREAPLSVASPLAAAGARAASPAAPSSSCTRQPGSDQLPCLAASGALHEPPRPASATPLQPAIASAEAALPALVNAATRADDAVIPALEGAPSPSAAPVSTPAPNGAEPVLQSEVAAHDGQASQASAASEASDAFAHAPAQPLGEATPAALEASALDAGMTPADAGMADDRRREGLRSSSEHTARSRPERGTNGALIFD